MPLSIKLPQANDEGSPSTKGEVTPAVSTSDDVIGPEMTAIENVVKHLHLDSWQVDNTQQVNCNIDHVVWNMWYGTCGMEYVENSEISSHTNVTVIV